MSQAIWWTAALLALMSLFTPWVVRSVDSRFWGFYPRFGWGGAAGVLFAAIVGAYTIGRFVTELRRVHRERHRRRIELILTSFSIGSLALLDSVAAFGPPLYPFGFLAVLMASGIGAAAVLRYRLSDAGPSFAAQQILETMQGTILVLDLNGKVRIANRAATELLGFRERELVGMDMSSIIASPLNIGNASDTLMRGGVVRDRAMVWRMKGGAHVEVAVSGSLLRDEDGIPSGIVYVALDISDRKRAEQIEYHAFHDPLTGLPNRLMFRNRLTYEIEDEPLSGTRISVLVLDLDSFKRVNEAFGHSVGDQLLQKVARRLRESVKERDSVARLGGDEFAILLRVRTSEEAARVAQRVLDIIARPFALEGEELFVTTSIGIAIHPEDGEDAEALIKNADYALYVAKESGRNSYQAGGPTIETRSRDRLLLEGDLRRALEHEQLVVHYQPIVSVKSRAVVAVEALLRWNHPTRGLLPPDTFIGIAEEVRLIVPIGEWVIRRACADARRWQLAGHRDLRVAVNLSPYQLQQPDIIAVVDRALADSGLSPASLQLEITESAAMQNASAAAEILQSLRDRGIHVAIDDFGTGYASLSYMKRFPIDTVKLDQSFVREMTSTAGDAAIVTAVIGMAHALELKVVAEGVESERQLSILAEMECDEMQGFLISQPLSSGQVERFLNSPRETNAFDLTASTRSRLKLVKPPGR